MRQLVASRLSSLGHYRLFCLSGNRDTVRVPRPLVTLGIFVRELFTEYSSQACWLREEKKEMI